MGLYPEDLRFCEEHLWVRKEGNKIRIGITEYLADKLGCALDVELADVGKDVDASAEVGFITGSGEGSVDVFTPVAGTVVAINEELFENPDILTSDPYDEGWLCLLKDVDADEFEELMDAKEYQAVVELAEAE